MSKIHGFVLAAWTACLVFGCGGQDAAPDGSGSAMTVRQGSEIDSKIRDAIGDTERELFDAFEAADPSVLRGLLADSVLAEIESGPGLQALFDQLRPRISGSRMEPFLDLYATGASDVDGPVRFEPNIDPPFVIEFDPPGDELYVSLRELSAGVRTRVLGLIYAREDGRWRLYTLRLGTRLASERHAMNWLEEATGLNSQGRLLPAMLRLTVASDLLRPLPFMHYENEQAVIDLRDTVAGELEAEYTFPLEVAGLPGPPRILRFEPVFLESKLSPLVVYVSGGVTDEAAVEAEATKMLEQLRTTFPGICFGADHVAFNAFAEMPTDPSKSYASTPALVSCAP
jgi:hypothetical protein